MIVPVMAISNLVLTRQIYSEETNGTHAHKRDSVPLISQYPLGTTVEVGLNSLGGDKEKYLSQGNTISKGFLSLLVPLRNYRPC